MGLDFDHDSKKQNYVNDPALGQQAISAYICTSLLVELLRSKSLDRILQRLGECQEVLLFREQIEDVKATLAGDSDSLALFLDLLSQGIVFSRVATNPMKDLSLYRKWSIVLLEQDQPTPEWPLSVLLNELSCLKRLWLARIVNGSASFVLTDSKIERAFVDRLGLVSL